MNKLTKKHTYDIHSLHSVSIVTITQLSRSVCLTHLYGLILKQDYARIIQWVIVEGSKTLEESSRNQQLVQELINRHETNRRLHKRKKQIRIQYVPFCALPLSNLRNIGHTMCIGKVIAIMDDDDYYFPTHVSHAVNRLCVSKKLIAGCSAVYMYDFSLDALFQFRSFHANHSTNNCFVFMQSYLNNHAHADGLSNGEEWSFTNGFREPMVQLNPRKCIIMSSHDTNTYNKKHLLSAPTNNNKKCMVRRCNEQETSSWMPLERINTMKQLFQSNGAINN